MGSWSMGRGSLGFSACLGPRLYFLAQRFCAWGLLGEAEKARPSPNSSDPSPPLAQTGCSGGRRPQPAKLHLMPTINRHSCTHRALAECQTLCPACCLYYLMDSPKPLWQVSLLVPV